MTQSLFRHKPYEKLLSYQRSLVIYLATVCFCRRFMNAKEATSARRGSGWSTRL